MPDSARLAHYDRQTMHRRLFDAEHDDFRASVRAFLAKEVLPPAMDSDDYELIKRVVAGYLDRLDSPEARRDLFCELFRQLALQDFQALYASTEWRTYLALHATFLSLTDGTLRDQVQAALAESEQAHNARVARAWREMTAVFGYRLRPGSGVTFDTLATLLSATMHGLIIAALSTPDVVGHRVRARPFGAVIEQEWSMPALGIGGIAATFLEPDPEVEWDEHRLARIHEVLRTWVPDDT